MTRSSPRQPWTHVLAAAALAASSMAFAPVVGSSPAAPEPDGWGSFGPAFVEDPGRTEVCVEDQDDDGRLECKPTAGSMSVLTDGSVLYFNALEGMEDPEANAVLEYGSLSINDQTRRLRFDASADAPQQTASWSTPTAQRADPYDEDYDSNPLFPDALSGSGDPGANDRSLFCADLVGLPNGDVLAVGGTSYYHDPKIPGTDLGVVELEGTRDTRIFDESENAWTAASSMNEGRWYPSLVTLPAGDLFVASGVTRLLKPAYFDDPLASGRNVTKTERRDHETGEWVVNEGGDKSLPLYPRLHLLPSGDILYNGGGQVFNPAGQSYDEALWNVTSVFDPETNTWTDLGVPGLGTTMPGFRGSASSTMLPLEPGEDGRYGTAEFLSAGGIAGVAPGTYVAQAQSAINRVTIGEDGAISQETRETDSLDQTRWYGTQVLLPDGSVMIFSGASADEVVAPGTGMPRQTAERFDPATEQWTTVARTEQARTYHNTATALRDGRVLVGGHAPIATLYNTMDTLVPGVTTPMESRNPTFEVFTPKYANGDYDRPEIVTAERDIAPNGGELTLQLAGGDGAPAIDHVLVMRATSTTHMIDGDQRAVKLPVIEQTNGRVVAQLPEQDAVLPPGNYNVFANTIAEDGTVVPSEGAQANVAYDAGDGDNLDEPAPTSAVPTVPVIPSDSPLDDMAPDEELDDLPGAEQLDGDEGAPDSPLGELTGDETGNGSGGAVGGEQPTTPQQQEEPDDAPPPDDDRAVREDDGG